MHATSPCLTPSSFWRLPGEKVCNCLKRQQLLECEEFTWLHKFLNSQGVFLKYFYPFSILAQWLQQVLGCSAALQDGSERKSSGWVAKSSQPLLRMRESRVCLPTLAQSSVTFLSFTKPSSLSWLVLRYLEMKCHRDQGLCPQRGDSVILSCLSFNLGTY